MLLVPDVQVRRLDLGYFVRPGSETADGAPRVEPCLGYLVRHPAGVLLLDTGMGAAPDVDAHYRPRRVDIRDALAAAGSSLDDVTVVTNCHLHFDHCGGNPLVGDRPVLVQRVELAEARATADYTLPELLDGCRFEPVDGEAEVLPDVWLVPTPGHTAGHQSLAVRRADGWVVVAGQSHDTASAYAADRLAWLAHRDQHAAALPDVPAWLDRLQRLDPRAMYFAHDHSVWLP